MRLPDEAHRYQPWRIHELRPDFGLEDVWALPTPGLQEDFDRLVQSLVRADPAQSSSRASRSLWQLRWKLGELLGWDDEDAGLGSRVAILRDRLSEDLRRRPGPEFAALPFRPLYLLDREFAAEIDNRTMHGVLHLGWIEENQGSWRGQMAVLAKPNGLLGRTYMTVIRPFRHLVLYPALMRQIQREWQAAARSTPAAA